MKHKSNKQSIIKLKLLIKTLEEMDIKTPLKITDIDFSHEKKSLTLTYSNGSKRGYIGNTAIKVMRTLKKFEK